MHLEQRRSVDQHFEFPSFFNTFAQHLDNVHGKVGFWRDHIPLPPLFEKHIQFSNVAAERANRIEGPRLFLLIVHPLRHMRGDMAKPSSWGKGPGPFFRGGFPHIFTRLLGKLFISSNAALKSFLCHAFASLNNSPFKAVLKCSFTFFCMWNTQ